MDGDLRGRFCAALTDAYTEEELAQLVSFQLEQRLDEIVNTKAAFGSVVFELVEWAEREGALQTLAVAAARDKPKRPELAALAAELAVAVQEEGPQFQRVDLAEKLRQPGVPARDGNATLITWLVDRLLQRDQLRRTVQGALTAGAMRPIVCLLPGSEHECHDKFVQVIVQHQLEALMPSRTAGSAQHRILNLPPSYRSRTELHDFLRADLGASILNDTGAGVEAMNARFATFRAPVVIQSLMRIDTWTRHEQEEVYDFLRFWAGWPAMTATQPPLLVFLCIRFQPKPKGFWGLFSRKSSHDELKEGLAAFAAGAPGLTPLPDLAQLIVAVLPELTPVSREDAEQWAQQPKVQAHFAGCDLVSAIGEIYRRLDKPALPMATLHAALADLHCQ